MDYGVGPVPDEGWPQAVIYQASNNSKPVSLFTVVRRQSSNQELLGVTSREVAQLTIAAR
jgi:hypothetical protein